MHKYIFLGGKFAISAISTLLASTLLITSCSTEKTDGSPKDPPVSGADIVMPASGGVETVIDIPVPVVEPIIAPVFSWVAVPVMARTAPVRPENELVPDSWFASAWGVDDQVRQRTPEYSAQLGPDGNGVIPMPIEIAQGPMVIRGYNDAYPLLHRRHSHREDKKPCGNNNDGFDGDELATSGEDCNNEDDGHSDHEHDDLGRCLLFEIFVPAFCWDKAPWLLGPVEDAVWRYYRRAALHRGEAWNPSQVDCATWITNLQLTILTDEVQEELQDMWDRPFLRFFERVLIDAFQENQHILTPTRPPICMAEWRHDGGGMDRTDEIFCHDHEHGDDHNSASVTSDGGDGFDDDDDEDEPFYGDHDIPVSCRHFHLDSGRPPFVADGDAEFNLDPVTINLHRGLVRKICGVKIGHHRELRVNGEKFHSERNFVLDDEDFMGTISDMRNITPQINVAVYNTRLGNGYEFDSDVYDDACAVTSIIEFTNTDDDEQDIEEGTGVHFRNLLGDDHRTKVFLTSDGDALVDGNDTWAIFYRNRHDDDEHHHDELELDENLQRDTCIGSSICDPREDRDLVAIAVELLGHRTEDFRDVLHMRFEEESGDLFLGLRADFELNEDEVDGERAFLAYTISTWDGRDERGRQVLRQDISNCYEAADVWAREFFITRDFQLYDDECCVGGRCADRCDVFRLIGPLEAAEFAVRSQCFSNSRSNGRWRTDDSGYWSINTDHGVAGNIIVNPGWLAPNLDFEVYIQKFDEAVFKGPRTVVTTDCVGQLMVDLPTVVEGDRILLKAQDSCCNDYDLVLPCVPDFTGFAGAPGLPYVPVTLGPPPLPIGPVGGPGLIGAGVGGPGIGGPGIGGPGMGGPGMGGPDGVAAQ